ncbi:MAG: PAS domain S-box protein, partial [candidate division KSB1 bacterium]
MEHPDTRPRKTILMIDDDADQREITRKILAAQGYHFVEVDSGEEGLKLALQHQPHLVRLDYLMPGMTGADFLHELTSNPHYKSVSETPVIMLTARTRSEVNQARLFQMGLRMYLEKPFNSHELINVIENVFALNDMRQRNRELEQRIKLTEYKYQDIIENANDLIFTLNAAGEFLFINRRLSVLTGYLREEWKDRLLLDMVLPEDRNTVEVNFKNTLKGKSRIFEMRIPAHNGKTLFLSTNINPILEHGQVAGCVGIARDVTQRKKLEQEITDLKNFNESVIQSIGSGLITLDLDRRITSFNQAAEEMTGWQAEEVIGLDLEEILPAEEVRRLLPEADLQALRDSSLLHREMEITRKDRKRIYVGYTVSSRRDNRNQHVGTIISFRDISQIKQMQAEVLRMDRLASLGVLASGIAHEIRNPLAGIKTVAQTLEEDLEEGDGKREYLARIIRQVNRMDELLRTLFSYARPQSPLRRPHKLQDIINEVKGLMLQRFELASVRFEEIYAEDLPLIQVDFHQTQQVFINLFLNAIDAMNGGGSLTVHARPATTPPSRGDRRGKRYPEAQRRGQFAEVRVSDTGEGISRENMQAIFDPFFTTKPQGSGLGLSIVYRIIEEHR